MDLDPMTADIDVACTSCGHETTTRLADWPEALAQDEPQLIQCPNCEQPGTLMAPIDN